MTEPFIRYEAAFRGKSDLKTVTIGDVSARHRLGHGAALYSAMYLNELLVRAEPMLRPDAVLFAAYDDTLKQLTQTDNLRLPLRRFEQIVLNAHGMLIDFTRDNSGELISANAHYRLDDLSGFVRSSAAECARIAARGFLGQDLLDVVQECGDYELTLARAYRLALMPLAGAQPFKARQLFRRVTLPVKRVP